MGARHYEIPSYTTCAVPDGDRWLLVYHDGDEESVVRHEDGWFQFGATNGDWRVASTLAPPDPAITRVEPNA